MKFSALFETYRIAQPDRNEPDRFGEVFVAGTHTDLGTGRRWTVCYATPTLSYWNATIPHMVNGDLTAVRLIRPAGIPGDVSAIASDRAGIAQRITRGITDIPADVLALIAPRNTTRGDR